MTRWFIVAGLVVLNGILGVGVYQRLGGDRTAQAQIGGGARMELVSIAGVLNGQTVIYVMDANSGMLVARRIDAANARMDPPIRRDVAADLRRLQ
jgi:hypothetical protein